MTTTAPVRARRRRWPVPPSLLLGLAPIVVFAAISAWRSRPSDDYATLGQTVDSVVHALVIPEGIAVVALALFVTALGWWRTATVDPVRTRLRWTMLAPILVLVVCIVRLPLIDWTALPSHYFLLLAVGVLFVGGVRGADGPRDPARRAAPAPAGDGGSGPCRAHCSGCCTCSTRSPVPGSGRRSSRSCSRRRSGRRCTSRVG
ncbi:hypothetical protein WDV91_03005 [Curtobacterium flaccumfaciens pv. flaccumfaciens]